MSDVEPQRGEVAEALSRLLAWPEIARSAQLGKFLEYIVDRTLKGEEQAIKAYSIAVDVLGRPADFDPQSDPIVRVQARRLRTLLEQYYLSAGADENVRIHLPTGRYVPDFVRVVVSDPVVRPPVAVVEPDAIAPEEPRRLPISWFVLAGATLLAVLIGAGITLWGWQAAPTVPLEPAITAPTVSVMELQSLAGADDASSTVAGLAVELVTDLKQFESFHVVYGGGTPVVEGDADYALSGIVRRERGGLQYSAILTDVASNSVVWSKAVVVDAARVSDPEILDQVSGELSRNLGSPRGPLNAEARRALAERTSLAGTENLYACRMLFDLYREEVSKSAGKRAEQCYAGLPEAEKSTGQAIAASASLVAEGFDGLPADAVMDERDAYVDAQLRRAIEVAPISGFVWEQRARFLEGIGEDAGADAAYSSALQLNPANSDTLAARARHLALTGRLAEAELPAQLALDSTPNPPAWYLGVPALANYRAGNYRQAAYGAQRYAEADREFGPILTIMAGQALGDQQMVANYLPRVLDVASFRADGILTQLRKRISDETLIRDIRQALLAAGLAQTVLNQPF